MIVLRHLPQPLRRARLLAAREYPVGAISRRAILGGHYDGGEVVGKHLRGGGDGA